jgi:hypothetical protein
MSSENLYRNLLQLAVGIETCLEKGLRPPALVLIYSAIEIASTLSNEDPTAGSRRRFVEWVDRYLLKAKPLNCSAIDLYAARCGLVHSFTSDADLIEQGKARRLFYAWGTAKAADLQALINRANKQTEMVAVHIRDLVEGWRLGMALFHDELESDPERQKRVHAVGERFFGDLAVDVVGRSLELTKPPDA